MSLLVTLTVRSSHSDVHIQPPRHIAPAGRVAETSLTAHTHIKISPFARHPFFIKHHPLFDPIAFAYTVESHHKPAIRTSLTPRATLGYRISIATLKNQPLRAARRHQSVLAALFELTRLGNPTVRGRSPSTDLPKPPDCCQSSRSHSQKPNQAPLITPVPLTSCLADPMTTMTMILAGT